MSANIDELLLAASRARRSREEQLRHQLCPGQHCPFVVSLVGADTDAATEDAAGMFANELTRLAQEAMQTKSWLEDICFMWPVLLVNGKVGAERPLQRNGVNVRFEKANTQLMETEMSVVVPALWTFYLKWKGLRVFRPFRKVSSDGTLKIAEGLFWVPAPELEAEIKREGDELCRQ